MAERRRCVLRNAGAPTGLVRRRQARFFYLALARIVDNLAEQGLEPAAYRLPGAQRGDATADLRTTETALRLARHLLQGRVDPRIVCFGWSLPRRERSLREMISAAVDDATIGHLYRTLEPEREEYRALKHMLGKLRELQVRGGWPLLESGAVLHRRDTGGAVAALRRRLQTSTDYEDDPTPRFDFFDEGLERAVRAFQERYGLEVDGIVGRQTFGALNVPVDRTIDEIELNLERWRWMPEDIEPRYVEINIPAFEMRLVEDGRLQFRSDLDGHDDRLRRALREP